jgi:UDPglucose--hexose-1-phosphate uridylyltransferase
MTQYIHDVSTRKWVIISPKRTERPDNFVHKKTLCPFCPGQEKISEEVLRYPSEKKHDWKLRVIKNKFPVTEHHEVVIHSPEETDNENLPLEQVILIFKAYKDRYNFFSQKGNVTIFCNEGEHAGASIKHPHSQIIVTPFEVNLHAFPSEPVNNIVEETEYFTVYCPHFSQRPYEIWMKPRKNKGVFGDITEVQIHDLAQLLQKYIKRLRYIYKHRTFSMLPFAYNYYIYPKENWYFRIIPRFIHKGGFELASHVDINIVDPVKAATDLKDDNQIISVLDKLETLQK